VRLLHAAIANGPVVAALVDIRRVRFPVRIGTAAGARWRATRVLTHSFKVKVEVGVPVVSPEGAVELGVVPNGSEIPHVLGIAVTERFLGLTVSVVRAVPVAVGICHPSVVVPEAKVGGGPVHGEAFVASVQVAAETVVLVLGLTGLAHVSASGEAVTAVVLEHASERLRAVCCDSRYGSPEHFVQSVEFTDGGVLVVGVDVSLGESAQAEQTESDDGLHGWREGVLSLFIQIKRLAALRLSA